MRQPKNANYDFDKQKQPESPMGKGSFANMPEKPIMQDYSKEYGMRDGLINSFTATLEKTSKIHENQR